MQKSDDQFKTVDNGCIFEEWVNSFISCKFGKLKRKFI